MSEALEFEGDDLAELVDRAERMFGVRYTSADPMPAETVGTIFDDLRRRVPPSDDGRCATSMAFFRLRRALQRERDVRLRPSSPMPRHWHTQGFLRRLARDTGLRMPAHGRGRLSDVGALLVLAALVVAPSTALVMRQWAMLWPAVPTLTAGLACIRLDPGRPPEGCETVGDVARRMAVLNIGRLRQAGARTSEQALWDALTSLISDLSDRPVEDLARTTRMGFAD